MKRLLLVSMAVLVAGPHLCYGQVGGNVGYSQPGGRAKAEQNELNKRVLTDRDVPPTGTGMFIDASVLMNVKADEYVAVFGVTREDETVEGCGRKMDATIKEFSDAVGAMRIVGDDLFVDFVAQNKIYGFQVEGDIAREKLVGFELKKNISIRYKDRLLLDRFVVAAARSQIFDLIKVDYIVKDADPIRERLMDEAARVIKRKTDRYEKLLGIKLKPPAQVYADRPSIYYPTQMYDSYIAFEAEDMGAAYRQKYTTQSARKTRTFFFNGLAQDGFDEVINPVIVEPVVQFTLYLKVKYEVEQTKAK